MTMRRRLTVATLSALALAALGLAPASAAAGDPITVTGVVTGADGAPVEGAPVNVFHGDGQLDGAITGADGAYSVTFAAESDWEWLSVSTFVDGAMCDDPGLVEAPATVVVNCAVPDLVTVTFSGTVVMTNGSSPAGQWVSANDASYLFYANAVTEEDGSFTLQIGVPATSAYIEVYGPGGEYLQVTDFEDGTVFDGLLFESTPWVSPDDMPMTVTGHVTDRKGRPLEGVDVEVFSGYNGFQTTTDAAGDYTLTGTWPWLDGQLMVDAPFVRIDGQLVDIATGLSPDAPLVVDYQQHRTALFEPYVEDLDMSHEVGAVDLYRKVRADGSASWVVFVAGEPQYGFDFGTKKTDFLGVTPPDDFTGVQTGVLRTKVGDTYEWYRFEAYPGMNEQATFGERRLDGVEMFRFSVDGGSNVVAWSDKGGDTTVWSWGLADGLGVQSIEVPGRVASMQHVDLDGDGADSMVAVTHHGKRYVVTLLPTPVAEPVVIAEGRGAPTLAFEDTDGDGVLEVLANFAE